MDNIILVVEGNPDHRALILHAIGDANVGAEVVVARNGIEALNWLFARGAYAGRDIGVQPRLILLDPALPRMGGLEVLRRIRADERTKFLRVVALSSFDDPRDVTGAYRAGVNSFIRKPTDPRRFAEVVRLIVQYWLTVSEPPPEGRIGRRWDEPFRAVWFRAPLIGRRTLRRAAVLVGAVALLMVYRRRTRG